MHQDRTLRTARTLPFPPRAVYEGFASAHILESWWGPDGFTNSFERFEFRVGGQWAFTMHGPGGTAYPNKCIFVALEAAQRVVIRHDCPPYFTLSVLLAPAAGGTQLTWEQEFDDAKTAEALKPIAAPANEQNLDRLTRALAAAAVGEKPMI